VEEPRKEITGNMKLIKYLIAGLTAIVVASGLALSAHADQISGNINFAGAVTFDNTHLGSATMVNSWDLAIVTNATDDFSVVPSLTPVAFVTPYVFNPPTAYASLWTVGGFTFSLVNSHVDAQSNFKLTIFGDGFVSGNGFDQTPGTWSFSVTQSDGRAQNMFSFQANSAAVPTPDSGSTVALLGMTLFAVGTLRAKFRG
jgi:VPDSG-CTERM motif